MKEQKKLSGTQVQLLAIKDVAIGKARQDFQQTLNMIATEHGIENLTEWTLSKDGQYLIKVDKTDKL